MFDKIMKFLSRRREPVNPSKIGESYMVPDGRKGHEGEKNWIHTRHS